MKTSAEVVVPTQVPSAEQLRAFRVDRLVRCADGLAAIVEDLDVDEGVRIAAAREVGAILHAHEDLFR